jgi:hypothetical protein
MYRRLATDEDAFGTVLVPDTFSSKAGTRYTRLLAPTVWSWGSWFGNSKIR